MENQKKKIIVGMSGGVDSSVAAFLLKQQGHEVVGLFMKNWEEQDENGICQSSKEYEDVIRVCDHIDIPYYSVNFSKEYWDQVFSVCLEEFKKGYTPNPDVLCNREIKFKSLLKKARSLGGDYLATGHYCQTDYHEGEYRLLKGKDAGKDQSYFLYMVNSAALKYAIFPIGDREKSEVREIARKNKIPTAEKKDSTGICFIGKRNFKEFLGNYIPPQKGFFENTKGEVIGTHDGASFYTVGQRKGLKIGGPGEAWFVIGKDAARNVVIVEQGENHPSLFSDQLTVSDLSWISSRGAPDMPYSCQAKIRYRQEDAPCTIASLEEGKAIVTFASPQRAVTSGQSIVFYNGAVCLGGGIIL